MPKTVINPKVARRAASHSVSGDRVGSQAGAVALLAPKCSLGQQPHPERCNLNEAARQGRLEVVSVLVAHEWKTPEASANRRP